MTIRRTLADGAVVLSVAGSMAGSDLGDLHRELVTHLRARRTRIVLDFEGVDHVSYHDASLLAREFDLVRNYDGEMRLAGVSPYVRDILLFAGLSGLFETYARDAKKTDTPVGLAD